MARVACDAPLETCAAPRQKAGKDISKMSFSVFLRNAYVLLLCLHLPFAQRRGAAFSPSPRVSLPLMQKQGKRGGGKAKPLDFFVFKPPEGRKSSHGILFGSTLFRRRLPP